MFAVSIQIESRARSPGNDWHLRMPQTRTFTYDNLGRLKSETHPESGTKIYTYDENSNLETRTDARGIVTTYEYDVLNRLTLRTYSDGTPSVGYYYDSAPPASPIPILNPIGRLTRITTTASGVTTTSYYSYCNCSSVDQEATVVTDGTTRTYVTGYIYDLLGQLTSIAYPNGKVVTYGRDGVGRENKVSSTIGGQSIDYVSAAEYLGPRGELTRVEYGLRYDYWVAVQAAYTYSPVTLRLTGLQTLGLSLSYNYSNGSGSTGRIYDIVDNYDQSRNQHFDYDHLRRLTSYWRSYLRDAGTPSLKIDWTYDRYGSMLTQTRYNVYCPPQGCLDTFTVDPATNRLLLRTPWNPPPESYAYDAVGNQTGNGRTYDAENRLLGWTGTGFLYDGASHRFRKVEGSSRIFYIYSVKGFLLVEDDWSAGTTMNQIYFNGQLMATHDQSDTVRFLFKDHLGSTRSIATVTPGQPWGYDWETTAVFDYNPHGNYNSTWGTEPPGGRPRFTGKEREANGLDYFGARYYDSANTFRWILPDSLTARIYDPLSLNKYSYVRNDPINLIDPDGLSFERAECISRDPETGRCLDYEWYEADMENSYVLEREGSFGGGDLVVDLDLVDYQAKSAAALKQAQDVVDKEDCSKFLNAVISDLYAGNTESGITYSELKDAHGNQLTAQSLVNLLTKPGMIVDNAPRAGHLFANAYTPQGGPVHLIATAYTENLYATLVHEAFHIVGPETTAFHDDLAEAMKRNTSLLGPYPGIDDPRTAYIRRNCV